MQLCTNNVCVVSYSIHVMCCVCIQDESLDYECVLDIENQSVVVNASVEPDAAQPLVFLIVCQPYQVRRYFSVRGAVYLKWSLNHLILTSMLRNCPS